MKIKHKGLVIFFIIVLCIVLFFVFWPRLWLFGNKSISIRSYGAVSQLSSEDAEVIKKVLNGKRLVPDNYCSPADTWSIQLDKRRLYYLGMEYAYPNVLYDDKTGMYLYLSDKQKQEISKVFTKVFGKSTP